MCFFYNLEGYFECSLAAQCQCKLEWTQGQHDLSITVCRVSFIQDESEGRNLFTGESYFTASTVILRSLSLFLSLYCTFSAWNAEAAAWYGFHRVAHHVPGVWAELQCLFPPSSGFYSVFRREIAPGSIAVFPPNVDFLCKLRFLTACAASRSFTALICGVGMALAASVSLQDQDLGAALHSGASV